MLHISLYLLFLSVFLSQKGFSLAPPNSIPKIIIGTNLCSTSPQAVPSPSNSNSVDTTGHKNNHTSEGKQDSDFLSQCPHETDFYEKSLRYFLESTSPADLETRMQDYCQRFNIEKKFKDLNTTWYAGRTAKPFKKIQEEWVQKTQRTIPALILDNEHRTRMIQATCHLLSSQATFEMTPELHHEIDAAKDCADLGEVYLHKFLQIQSEEEFQHFFEECLGKFHISKNNFKELTLHNQRDDCLDQLMLEVRQKWKSKFAVTIPPHIDTEQTQSLVTLLTLGMLSTLSWKPSVLQTKLSSTDSYQLFEDLPQITEIPVEAIQVLKQEGWIITTQKENSWNQRKICFMTLAQKEHLESYPAVRPFASLLYLKSFFAFLRELTQEGPSEETPTASRYQFIAELEQFLVTIHAGGAEALATEKAQQNLSLIKMESFPDFASYEEVVEQFQRKIVRLRKRFYATHQAGAETLTPQETKSFWKNTLKEQSGLCPAGSVGQVLNHLETFYNWSRITSAQEALGTFCKLYYDHIVQIIAGTLISISGMQEENEAHTAAYVHSILAKLELSFFSEVEALHKDTYAITSQFYTCEDIKKHFHSLWTPYHFGVFCLTLFQDKNIFTILSNLSEKFSEQDFEDIFLTSDYSIAMDQFIRYIGQEAVVFKSPTEYTEDLWKYHLRNHNFTKLQTLGESYWHQTFGGFQTCLEYTLAHTSSADFEFLKPVLTTEIGALTPPEKIQLTLKSLGASNSTMLEHITQILGTEFIHTTIIQNPLSYLLRSIRSKSPEIVKKVVLIIQEDTSLITEGYFLTILETCLDQDMKGFEIFKFLYEKRIIVIPDPDQCYTELGRSFLTHIVLSSNNQSCIIKFLEYFITTLNVSKYIYDKNYETKITTFFHAACEEGKLEIVEYCVETLHLPLNYLIDHADEIEENKEKYHFTPLTFAVLEPHTHIIKYLLKKGADFINYDIERGSSALQTACRYGHLHILEIFYQHDPQKLITACYNSIKPIPISLLTDRGHLHIIEFLLEKAQSQGTLHHLLNPPHAKTKYQLTPLLIACKRGHLSLVKLLINHDPRWRAHHNRDGLSAPLLAAREGHLDIVQFFVEEHHVNPEYHDGGNTILDTICTSNQLHILQWLIPYYAKTYRDLDLSHCVTLAIKQEHLDVIQYLIVECGVEMTPRCRDFLAKSGQHHIIKIAEEIQSLENFLPKNPFLSQYRRKQLQEYIKTHDESTLLPQLLKLEFVKSVLRAEDDTLTPSEKIAQILQALGASHPIMLEHITQIRDAKFIHTAIAKNPLSYLLRAIQCQSLNVVKKVVHIILEKPSLIERIRAEERHFLLILNACLYQDLKGFETFQLLYEKKIIVIPAPDQCYTELGRSFLTHIVLSSNNQSCIIKFLEYFITTLNVSQDIYDQELDRQIYSFFHIACQEGYLEVIQYCIETLHLPVDYTIDHADKIAKNKSKNRFSILTIAVSRNHPLIIDYLLKKGADFNNSGAQKRHSPLLSACKHGYLHVIKTFYQHDPQKLITACYNSIEPIPISILTYHGHLHIIEFLLEKAQSQGTLHHLLNPPHAKTKYKLTPLLIACKRGHLSLVKLLINHDPRWRTHHNRDGLSAPLLAAREGHLDIVQFFVKELHVNPEYHDCGNTILDTICTSNQLHILQWLIPYYAKTYRALDLSHCVTLAVEKKHLEIIQYLIVECGVEMTPRCRNFLAKSGQYHIIEIAETIQSIEEFIPKNPFLSQYRRKQLQEYIETHDESTLLPQLLKLEFVKSVLRAEDDTLTPSEKIAQILQTLGASYPIMLEHITQIRDEKFIHTTIAKNPLSYLLRAIQYQSLNVVKKVVHIILEKPSLIERIRAEERYFLLLLNACLDQDLKGFETFKFLYEKKIIVIPALDQCYTELGRSFLTHIVLSSNNQSCIINFLGYFITTLNVPQYIYDQELDHQIHSFFHVACQEGYLEVIQYCIETLHLPVDYMIDHADKIAKNKSKNRFSILTVAVSRNHPLIIDYLLKKGADFNKSGTQKGDSPLLSACRYGHLHIIKTFYQHDPQKLITACYSSIEPIPISVLTCHGHLHIIEFLLEKAQSQGTLHHLLNPPHTETKYQLTPLLIACERGHLSLVKLLINHDPRWRAHHNRDGLSAPLLAAQEGHLDIIKFFVKELHVKPEYHDCGNTILDTICTFNQLHILQWLIPYYAKKYGPLDLSHCVTLAIEQEHLDVIQYLIVECGVEMTPRCRDFLAKSGQHHIIKIAEEIQSLENFLPKNPFLSQYRYKQLQEYRKTHNLSTLLPQLLHWKNFFYDTSNEVAHPSEIYYHRKRLTTPQNTLALRALNKVLLNSQIQKNA